MSSSPLSVFWCHQCLIEIIPLYIPDLTCPYCHGSFVEKIEEGGSIESFMQEDQGGNQEENESEYSSMRILLDTVRSYLSEPQQEGNLSLNVPAENRVIIIDSTEEEEEVNSNTSEPTSRSNSPDSTSDFIRSTVDDYILTFDQSRRNSRQNINGSTIRRSLSPINLDSLDGISRADEDIPYVNNGTPSHIRDDFPLSTFNRNGQEIIDVDALPSDLGSDEINLGPIPTNNRLYRRRRHSNEASNGLSPMELETRINSLIDEQMSSSNNRGNLYHELIQATLAQEQGSNSDGYESSSIEINATDYNSSSVSESERSNYSLTDFLRMVGSAVRNPRDYAIGSQAFDNIVTRLLDETDGNTPRPASYMAIKSLPKEIVFVKNDFLEECAVCKDEYQIDESVTSLPCQHRYHSPCIEAWLFKNGTCPICRHSLASS